MAYQDIQVAEAAERKVAVGHRSQDRTLERNSANPLRFEQAQEFQQLPGQRQAELSALAVLRSQQFQGGGRHSACKAHMQRPVHERHDRVAARCMEQVVPVEVLLE